MKKKILLLAVFALCMAILATSSLAYFTAEEETHNVITTAGVDIELQEWQQTADGLVPYPGEKLAVMPGATVSKIVTVKNLQAPVYIRAKFDVVITLDEGETPTIPEGLVTVHVNGDEWVRKDGDTEWWYYNGVVEEDASTEAFVTSVEFSGPDMGNEYQNSEIDVIVTAQAVQVANNGTNALTATGWSAE